MIAKDGATPSRFEEERDNPFPGIGGGHHILGTGLSGPIALRYLDRCELLVTEPSLQSNASLE